MKKKIIRVKMKDMMTAVHYAEETSLPVTCIGGEWFRKAVPEYVVIHWINDNENMSRSFNRLLDAKKFADKEYKNERYEIKFYEDIDDLRPKWIRNYDTEHYLDDEYISDWGE